MSTGEPTEDELRAAYEEEIKQIRVEHVVMETVVTLINLGMRRTGLMPGTETERDPGQVQMAIESVRAVMPVIEEVAPDQIAQIRQALSQLQLGYVRIGGHGAEPAAVAAASGAPSAPATPPLAPTGAGSPGSDPSTPPAEADSSEVKPGEAGPAQRSGRLWVPGQ